MLMMDLSQLEADELAYEERIRAHYATPRNHLMLSSLGKVSQWMEDERAVQTDPSTLVHGLTPDQIPAELDVCAHHINTIYDAVTAAEADNGDLADLQRANRMASRLVHYHWRLKRLEGVELTEPRTVTYNQALRHVRTAGAVIATRIIDLTRRNTSNVATNTPAGNTTNATTSTENGNLSGVSNVTPTYTTTPTENGNITNVSNATQANGSGPQAQNQQAQQQAPSAGNPEDLPGLKKPF